MNPSGFFPMFATDRLADSRDFYAELGFEAVFDGEWYVHLAWPTNPTLQIGFVTPGHPSQAPVYQTRFTAGGAFLGLEVDDVDTVYRDLTTKGHAITVTLKNEPWGQRHFGIADPNGVAVDIFSPIPATGAYAEPESAMAWG